MKKSAFTIILAAAVTATSFAAVSAAEPEQEIMLIASAPYTLNVNGKTAGVKYEVYKENDKIMVPLRFVAENLGFKVEWNEENQAVRLDDGTVNTMVRIGGDSYYMASSTAIGMSAPTPLGAAPVIKGEFTYVPADMFNILCGKTAYTVKDNTVEFDLSAEDSTQIPNPFIEYKTVDDAKKALSFNAKIPAKLPDVTTNSDAEKKGTWFLNLNSYQPDDICSAEYPASIFFISVISSFLNGLKSGSP